MGGDFGGAGDTWKNAPGPDHTFSFAAGHEGKPAFSLKGYARCASGGVALFEAPSLDTPASRTAAVAPSTLATVGIVGKITLPPGSRSIADLDVTVAYDSGWTCEFYGLSDCLLGEPTVGTTRANADGTFGVTIPDYFHDPALARFADKGSVMFLVREPRTLNIVYSLRVDEGGDPVSGSIPVQPAYDAIINFRAVPWKF